MAAFFAIQSSALTALLHVKIIRTICGPGLGRFKKVMLKANRSIGVLIANLLSPTPDFGEGLGRFLLCDLVPVRGRLRGLLRQSRPVGCDGLLQPYRPALPPAQDCKRGAQVVLG